MVRYLKTVALVAVLAVSSVARAQPDTAQSEMVDGTVTKIDQAAGKITIKHGPLKQFDMAEGMTMVFRAQDPAMLKTVKAGDKVKFMPERINGQFTVTKIQKAK
jgi:Cu(I)/Ag(I) efflux system periplasmic protein CusF